MHKEKYLTMDKGRKLEQSLKKAWRKLESLKKLHDEREKEERRESLRA